MNTQSYKTSIPAQKLDTIRCQQTVVRNPIDGIRSGDNRQGVVRLDILLRKS